MLLGVLKKRDIARLDAKLFSELGMVRLAAEQLAQMRAGAGQRLGLAADARIVAFGIDDHQVAGDSRLVAV